MLNQRITELLNQQINMELFSAYLYLDMANYYSEEGLNGFENWFYIQAQEERDHAMLIRTYMLNNSEKVVFEAIGKPGIEYKSFDGPLKEALEHERFITDSINTIYVVV